MADRDTRAEAKEPDTSEQPLRRRRLRSLWLFVGLLVGFVIYAYGFQVTEVSLDKITDETRQTQLFRVIRALAQPDLITYEVESTAIDLNYMVPCPAGGFEAEPVEGEATFTVDPPCAEPREVVTISGSGFRANDSVQVFFVPPNGTELRLANVRTDPEGSFQIDARLSNRPDTEVQTVRVKSRLNVGSIIDPVYVERENGELLRSPRWSQNAVQTLDLIIETVFLALLATTLGTLIAMPLSFFAARNLMRDVRMPALQLGLAVAGIPIGLYIGLLVSRESRRVIETLPDSAWLQGAVALGAGVVVARLIPIAVPVPGSNVTRTARIAAGVGAAAVSLIAAQALVRLSQIGGAWAAARLGVFDFIGEFVVLLGQILGAAFDAFAALGLAGVLAYMGSRLGYRLGRRVTGGLNRVLSILAGAVAGALMAMAVGQVLAWLYQIVDTQRTVVIPAVVGAVLGAAMAWRSSHRGPIGVGLAVYYTARTVFNALRSIEALVLALVFVIWVGLGPFAGALALALHTIAANAKLYSEQVESINAGPVEAVRATGATRLQTVVYAVVPQIVAPYISFTMYRWDINVRFSTIIGFVGGGGIGFLLQQNIGLLDYRAAAAQMLAIAIVVSTMDWASSRLRERFV
ncbi:MAG TPA: ABC transporter permease subunit [Acidimicrobiia bacterium]|nr:ABC transporter permease subunit [Acidimicrobiia bacterium]